MSYKTARVELAILHKAHDRRQPRIMCVGNHFASQEFYSMRFSATGHSGGLHIYCMRSVSTRQFCFLLDVGHRLKTDQDSFACARVCAAAVAGVQYMARSEHLTCFQLWIQSSGKSRGNY